MIVILRGQTDIVSHTPVSLWVVRVGGERSDSLQLRPLHQSEPALRRREVLHSQCSSTQTLLLMMSTNGGYGWNVAPTQPTYFRRTWMCVRTHTDFLLGDRQPLLSVSMSSAKTCGAACLVGIRSMQTDAPRSLLEMKRKAKPKKDASHPPYFLCYLTPMPPFPRRLLFLLARRSITLIGSLSHRCIDCSH